MTPPWLFKIVATLRPERPCSFDGVIDWEIHRIEMNRDDYHWLRARKDWEIHRIEMNLDEYP